MVIFLELIPHLFPEITVQNVFGIFQFIIIIFFLRNSRNSQRHWLPSLHHESSPLLHLPVPSYFYRSHRDNVRWNTGNSTPFYWSF